MRRQSKLDALRRASWWKPEFTRLENEEIAWRLGDERIVEDASISDCLVAFIKLSEAVDAGRFESFSNGFGVLNLDYEGRPLPTPRQGNHDLIDRTSWHRESIGQWKAYAKSAVLLVASSNALHDEADASDDRVMDSLGWRIQSLEVDAGPALSQLTAPLLRGSTPRDKRTDLAERLQRFWVSQSNLAPVFDWNAKSPSLQIQIGAPTRLIENDDLPGVYWNWPSVFDVLTAALVEAILTNQRLTRCDNCGELMLMSPKARTDQRHYCPVCAPIVYRELNRELQRKRYQRMKEASSGEQ